MADPLVSIIIPVYNAEKYLSQAIVSALQQTWQNIEVVIVDDGSTDTSLFIAKQYESDRVKVFTQANKAASAARNNGLRHAKGEYIQFLDADDLLSPDKISAQMDVLSNNDGYIGLSKTAYFNEDDNYSNAIAPIEWFVNGSDDPVDFLIKLYAGDEVLKGYGGMIQPNAWLTPKKIIDKAGPWNENLTVDDDGEFFCRVILASKGVRYSPNGTNYYRKFNNRQSLSGGHTQKSFDSIKMATDLKMSHLKEITNNPIIDKVFARHYWWAGINSYPKFKKISDSFIKKAKALNYQGQRYHAGPFTNVLTKIFGWRFARIFTYIRHGF
jgi:glycosyltransferase involved in cell wall biosynthesis